MARGHGADDVRDIHHVGAADARSGFGSRPYLVQPAEPLELAAAVNALLRIRRSEDQLRSLNETLEGQVKARTAELSRAITALKASADRMRTLLHTTYILQGYMTPDGVLLDANRASLECIIANSKTSSAGRSGNRLVYRHARDA